MLPSSGEGSGSCRYGRIATTVPSATSASKAPQWEECGTSARAMPARVSEPRRWHAFVAVTHLLMMAQVAVAWANSVPSSLSSGIGRVLPATTTRRRGPPETAACSARWARRG